MKQKKEDGLGREGLPIRISVAQRRSPSTCRARLAGIRIRVDYVLSWKAGFTLLEDTGELAF